MGNGFEMAQVRLDLRDEDGNIRVHSLQYKLRCLSKGSTKVHCIRAGALALLLTFAMSAQPRSGFEFDVASVKRAKECLGSQRFRNTRGSLEVLNMQPTVMIRNAYRLIMEGQLAGAPNWADDECFDIEAKVEEGSAIELEEARSRNLLRLQSLLVSRFQLRSHWENKMQQAYVLVAGKNGPKLKSAEPGSSRHTRQGHGTLYCASCTISNLAAYLSNFLTRPVRDETGIQGVYNMSLEFEPYDDAPSDDGLGRLPSLFTALQD